MAAAAGEKRPVARARAVFHGTMEANDDQLSRQCTVSIELWGRFRHLELLKTSISPTMHKIEPVHGLLVGRHF